MFQNLSNAAEVQISSEEDLLLAAGETKSVKKDEKNNGKSNDKKDEKPNPDKTDKSKSKKDKSDPEKKVTVLSKTDLEEAFGDEAEEEEEDSDDEKTDDKKDKIKPGKSKDKKSSKDDENQKDDDEDESDDKVNLDNDDKDEEGTKGDDDEKSDDEANEVTVEDFLKSRVNFLIKKGEWAKFDGWEDVNWDEDTFAEIELKQREFKREQIREELLDSFGPYGRDIADYTSKGGDPEQLIDIFKEQQRIESLSLETEEGQKAVVYKYATEYLEMKPDKARKHIDRLIADKELEADATEYKTKMEIDIKAQEKALKSNQDKIALDQQQKIKEGIVKFSKEVSTLVNSMDDADADEKKELIKVLTKFDNKLENGTSVNDFYFKMAEFRKDLPNYLQLVRFVLNPKKYLKQIKNKEKTETSEKDFKLIRTSNKAKKILSAEGSRFNKDDSKKSTFKLTF